MVLTLLACERFLKGEKGYATRIGVWKLCMSGVPEHAFPVEAVAEIGPGRHGPFLDLQRSTMTVSARP
jgi:hypothetical protein